MSRGNYVDFEDSLLANPRGFYESLVWPEDFDRANEILGEERRMMEFDDPIIKDIEGYPGYEVSNYGNVYSSLKGEPHMLRSWTNQHGHEYVQLHDGSGKGKKCLIHRLVAEAFIENPNNLPFVRHLDDVPSHNYVENLAWGTPKDNRDDCVRNGHEYTKPVYCYETDTIYKSGAEAAYELGLTRPEVSMLCSGRLGVAHGYHVCYEEDMEHMLSIKDDWIAERTAKKPIHARNIDTGEELYFESRNEAADYLGIPACGISSVNTGHAKHTHRWTFWED